MAEPLRARRLSAADADAIAEFMPAAGWDPNATADSVRAWLQRTAAQNPFEPGTGAPVVGVFVGTRLVACITSIPTRFWNGRELAPAHWLKGFWVLEEHRSGIIGFLLLKEMLKQVGLAASMPAGHMARQLSVALGMTDLGSLRNYLEPLRMARILRRLDAHILELNGVSSRTLLALRLAKFPPLAWAAQALTTLWVAATRLPGALAARALTTRLEARLPDEADLDSLWARAQRAPGSRAARSGAYLRWRYEYAAHTRYWFASSWRGAELVGLAVLQHPERLDDARLAGLGIGSVVDLVLDPTSSGALPSLLAAARRWAKSASYDALLLTMSHRALRGPLMRDGYLPMPGNIHLMVRDPGGKHGLSPKLDEWLVTRGDAWSDHL